ncbi:MAG TPA: PEP-CTERM sorting domain-containing protein [Phycisphaerae bacterium]|nr:PEP-CTERM sorting domain-containing protein [Phycisphaerae bacterium]HOJ72506.1 PEP-CTERM sorting domain-containing protein [Phycisphaerae bacterium]HOM49833.1 PEP-CTERM sorting domain-containing protein [Phycisphaerae bacterium]HON65593.1 PEP-CTERM sorting domain-containing protein [Phycisphaerae bacterium]HOQ84279.1 PEP-CTERM sorting domain-containing protein [Phycisphaerae bacterium]
MRSSMYLAGTVLAIAGSTVHASIISGNFCSVAPIMDEPAGLVPAGNWNDLTSSAGYGANGIKTNAIYADGSNSGATIEWAVSEGGSQNTNDEVYRPKPPATLGLDIDDGHDQMMAGYLQASKNSVAAPWISLKVSGLNVGDFGGRYSVILYSDGDDDIAALTGYETFSIYSSEAAYIGGSPALATYYGRDKTGVNYSVTSDGTNPLAVYEQIVSIDPASPTEGNYVRFDGLSGTEFYVRIEGVGGEHGAALNGFQIVPEPATFVFLSLGSLAMLRRRR